VGAGTRRAAPPPGARAALEDTGFSYVPPLPGWEQIVENLATVPVVAAALGPVAGMGAARVVASHFAVIVRGTSQLFVAGPPVVAAAMGESPDKEALGGARAQTRAALARLDGRPVGVLCSDPKHYAGGLTGDASDKLARFVDLCDQFHLPVAAFVDQPGFVIGTEAERAGTIRRGARALFALYQSSVPRAAVLVRKVYGVAGAGMGTAPFRWAWPSGDWGSLPIEGGLEAAYRRELESAEDREGLRAEIQARLDAVRSPFRTAERFSVEEIVDPRDTRPLLCDWAARAHAVAAQQLGRKARGPRP
jgi:acetyl-CoA carboxylase carboxyltransferase component